jgi:hypothetical protein
VLNYHEFVPDERCTTSLRNVGQLVAEYTTSHLSTYRCEDFESENSTEIIGCQFEGRGVICNFRVFGRSLSGPP